MHVWRMKPDGIRAGAGHNGDDNNWFPHPSPDGKLLVFLSYDREVKGHPEDKDVSLRLLTFATGQVDHSRQTLRRPGDDQRPVVVARQQKLAFVSYQLVDYFSWSSGPNSERFTAIKHHV